MSKPVAFLLVDDDADDVLLFGETLREADPAAQLQTAGNGQEALDRLRNGAMGLPDVVFLDLNMPRMGGKECLLEIKSDPALQHIPVIIYTTSSQSKDVEETLSRGAVCFVTKPSSMKDLKRILAAVAEGVPDKLGSVLHNLRIANQHLEIAC